MAIFLRDKLDPIVTAAEKAMLCAKADPEQPLNPPERPATVIEAEDQLTEIESAQHHLKELQEGLSRLFSINKKDYNRNVRADWLLDKSLEMLKDDLEAWGQGLERIVGEV